VSRWMPLIVGLAAAVVEVAGIYYGAHHNWVFP
jgi:hypothetical protein